MVIQQIKDVGGITAIEAALNEKLRNTAPAKIVVTTIGASLAFAYIYSQLTHKVYQLYYYAQFKD